MTRHTNAMALLLSRGPATARQMVQTLGLSQPTISRTLAGMGEQVVRMGSGPSIQYALRDNRHAFQAVPVYKVNEEGQIHLLGTLMPVRPDGFVMAHADGSTTHSDGLPWWLWDMRPQGHLGRAFAQTHAASLGLAANPEHWSDHQVIGALLAHGHDTVGQLMIGETARERFLGMSTPVCNDPLKSCSGHTMGKRNHGNDSGRRYQTVDGQAQSSVGHGNHSG